MYINRIKTENLKSSIRQRIVPYMNRLKELDFVEGIVLLGGLANTDSRNFMDKFSDVDMAIFIQGHKFEFTKFELLPDFEFHVPFEGRLLEINVHQQFCEDEKAVDWDEGKKEAYTYTSEIIFDRNGEVKQLIDTHTGFNEEYRCSRLSIILSQYYWLVNINPLRQIERGYLFNAMDLLNTGLDLLIEGIYLYNRRYRPHPKWRIEIAKDLPWLPTEFEFHLHESFIINKFDEDNVLRRRAHLDSMFSELEKQVLHDNIFNNLTPYEYACLYGYVDRQIAMGSYASRNFDAVLKALNDEELTLFNGLVNEYRMRTYDDLLSIGESDIPLEYKKLITKIVNNNLSSH